MASTPKASGNPKITPGPPQKAAQPPSTMIIWPDAPSATQGPPLPTQVPGQTDYRPTGEGNVTGG